jgi:hypothetical protein
LTQEEQSGLSIAQHCQFLEEWQRFVDPFGRRKLIAETSIANGCTQQAEGAGLVEGHAVRKES